MRVLGGGLLALLVTGCAGEPPALQVGAVEYTRQELGALGPAQLEALADLTAFGQAVADGEVTRLIEPYVADDIRSIRLQRLALELAADRAGLGDAELRLAYDRYPQYELVVRHLVVMSERWRPPEHRDSARAVAAEALERALGGEPFETLAAEYSDEPGAGNRGGLLQPGREGSWVPEFWRAASSLEIGQVSPVVETEFGFHVIRLEERRRVPFEQVREDVLERVMDLPSSLGRAEDWAARRMAAARLDTAVVRDWVADSVATQPVVAWPDSMGVLPMTTGDLARLRAGATHPDTLVDALDAVRGAARTHMMLDRAGELGIVISESQQAAIDRSWRTRIARMAEAFGFLEGQSSERVKAAAIQAVTSPQQSVVIARSGVAELRPRLRALYPASKSDAVNSATSG